MPQQPKQRRMPKPRQKRRARQKPQPKQRPRQRQMLKLMQRQNKRRMPKPKPKRKVRQKPQPRPKRRPKQRQRPSRKPKQLKPPRQNRYPSLPLKVLVLLNLLLNKHLLQTGPPRYLLLHINKTIPVQSARLCSVMATIPSLSVALKSFLSIFLKERCLTNRSLLWKSRTSNRITGLPL